MTLTVRQLTNVGSPLYKPNGTIIANAIVSFTLVDAVGNPVDAFDATTGDRVVGYVTATTNASGEFTVNLWPNDRGDKVTYYVCKCQGTPEFKSQVPSGPTSLSWLEFKLASNSLTSVEVSALNLHIADIAAHGGSSLSNNPITTVGLTYGYLGGTIRTNNTPISIATGTILLTASQTNYVEVNYLGVVSANTVGFTFGRYPLAVVVTDVDSITSITDNRSQTDFGLLIAANNLSDLLDTSIARSSLSVYSIAQVDALVDLYDLRYAVKGGFGINQTINGGTSDYGSLLLSSTSHANKGLIGLGSLTTGVIYNELFNRFGIGVAPTHFLHISVPAEDNLYIDARTNPRNYTLGVLRIDHTAGTTGTRPIHLDIECNGFSDTHAIDTQYHATNLALGGDAHIYDIHIDTANSTGGRVGGIAVSKSGTGLVEVVGIETYHGVDVVEQRSGQLSNIEQAFKYTNSSFVDITANCTSSASNVGLFDNYLDYVYFGQSVTFDDIEFIFSAFASGGGTKSSFEYSLGGGNWQAFIPNDGTNGCRQNGNVSWDLPLAGWTTDTVNGVNKYWIRAKRTQTTLSTIPVENTVVVYASTIYNWNKDGDVSIRKLKASGLPVFADRATAQAGGLVTGDFYQTSTGVLMIV